MHKEEEERREEVRGNENRHTETKDPPEREAHEGKEEARNRDPIASSAHRAKTPPVEVIICFVFLAFVREHHSTKTALRFFCPTHLKVLGLSLYALQFAFHQLHAEGREEKRRNKKRTQQFPLLYFFSRLKTFRSKERLYSEDEDRDVQNTLQGPKRVIVPSHTRARDTSCEQLSESLHTDRFLSVLPPVSDPCTHLPLS